MPNCELEATQFAFVLVCHTCMGKYGAVLYSSSYTVVPKVSLSTKWLSLQVVTVYGHKNYVASYMIINMFNMETLIQLSDHRTTAGPYIASIP